MGKMAKHKSAKEESSAKRMEDSVVQKIGHELKVNPPKVLVKTEKKKGKKAAEKQRIAILMNKARAYGVYV
mgnify:CR=1 FL=1